MNHSINIAAKRSGLSPHVIRVWEKRYAAVAPTRTDTNRRLYSDDEIERLVLLKQATDAGYKISHLAPLATENLVDLLAKDKETQSQRESEDGGLPSSRLQQSTQFLDQSLEAIQELDAKTLEENLTQAALTLGHQGMIRKIIGPLAIAIGDLWRDGSITAAHEHFASSIIRVFLTNISKPFSIPETAPRLIIATPAGQIHELGAVIAFALATGAGWRATYLGTNLPAAEIAGAAIQNQADAVALSIVYPIDDPDLPEELQRLRQFLPVGTTILAGGRAAAAYGETLSKIHGVLCNDLDQYIEALDQARVNRST